MSHDLDQYSSSEDVAEYLEQILAQNGLYGWMVEVTHKQPTLHDDEPPQAGVCIYSREIR